MTNRLADDDSSLRLLDAGINTVRGSAAEAAAHLIAADPRRLPRFLPTLERMTDDPSPAVRAVVAEALGPLWAQDAALAIRLCVRLCSTTDDRVLKTHYVEAFLWRVVQDAFADVEPIVERMIRSSIPTVQRAGARVACWTSFFDEAAYEYATHCFFGSADLRLGMAQVLAGQVTRFDCDQALTLLFDDSDDDVRTVASQCFRIMRDDELGEHTDLVTSFVHSAAFSGHQQDLIRALQETTAQLPEVTCLVAERYIESRSNGSMGPYTGDAEAMSQLVVRLYSQTSNSSIKTRCLDLIDRMSEMAGLYQLDKSMEVYER